MLEDNYAYCNNDLALFLLNSFSCKFLLSFFAHFLNFLVFNLMFVSFVDKNITEQVQRIYQIVVNFFIVLMRCFVTFDVYNYM